MTQAAEHQASLTDPEAFWRRAAQAIDWDRPFDRVVSQDRGPLVRWFEGGRLNTCYNAVDRHVLNGRADQPALIYDSPLAGVVRSYTFAELQDAVARVAGMLAAQGVGHGDRVIVYMPMVPEAVFAMLACARLGAIHSVVFGGFSARELAKRIDDATPTVIVSASCGLEPSRLVAYKPLLDEALDLATHPVARCLILQRPQLTATLVAGRDLDWAQALAVAAPAGCVSVAATDPLYILYTSGTTGVPKGVVRDNGGHAVALAWSMAHVYGVRPGEVFWAASDIGWVVGHSYIVYGPLLHGCATVLYEGKPVGTPDAGAFWRTIERHGVSVFFTAPTGIRAVKRDDPRGAFVDASDLSSLRALFLAGERADPNTVAWAEQVLGRPVIDHWWQTELGWPALAACLGLGGRPVRHGSAGHPVPGFDFAVLGPSDQAEPAGETGDIVIRQPLPPGCYAGLWNNPDGFLKAFEAHPGVYNTGDAGFIDDDGYVHVMSRTDDIINVAGHRLSTGAMEQALSAHPDVAECAVVGAADALKGMVPVALVAPRPGREGGDDALCEALVRQVREVIGPVASFKSVALVTHLPKTRSGKVLRAAIRKIADGEPFETPPTIEDPATLDRVREALAKIGYPPKPTG